MTADQEGQRRWAEVPASAEFVLVCGWHGVELAVTHGRRPLECQHPKPEAEAVWQLNLQNEICPQDPSQISRCKEHWYMGLRWQHTAEMSR